MDAIFMFGEKKIRELMNDSFQFKWFAKFVKTEDKTDLQFLLLITTLGASNPFFFGGGGMPQSVRHF